MNENDTAPAGTPAPTPTDSASASTKIKLGIDAVFQHRAIYSMAVRGFLFVLLCYFAYAYVTDDISVLVNSPGTYIAIDRESGVGFIISQQATRNGYTRKCKTPIPDVIVNRTSALAVSSGAPNSSLNLNPSYSSVLLQGRIPAVLIARDYMYRACELSINMNMDKEDALKAYQMFLGAAENVIATTTQNEALGSAKIIAAPVPAPAPLLAPAPAHPPAPALAPVPSPTRASAPTQAPTPTHGK